MALQLSLALLPRKAPPRQRPVIERLRAVLKRMGIDWQYRALQGSVLLRPMLAARSGYQCMCGFYCCGDTTFERVDYCDRPALTYEERQAWALWRERVWRAEVHALWGEP